MRRIFSFFFAVLMVAGLLVSSFLIYVSLQAAANSPESQPPIAADTTVSLAQQGRTLFVSKGCLVCHVNDNVSKLRPGGFEFDDVPDLTHVQADADYLRRWLRDPTSVKSTTWMPNLNLSDAEIEALTVFLTTQNN